MALMAVPLVASVIMAVIPARTPHIVFEAIHTLNVVVTAVVTCIVCVAVFSGAVVPTALGDWFRVDALSAVFVALIGGIGLLTGIYSLPYIRHDINGGNFTGGQVKQYYVFFGLFIFTMMVSACSNNLIMMWVSIEATTLVTVFLVGVNNTKKALEAAWKYIIVCTAGVAFGLYSTLLVYSNAAAIMNDPSNAILWTAILPFSPQFDSTIIMIAFVFATIGFGTKAGLFPMHTWLPDAHSEAPSPVSALLSAVLLKCAILVIIRFYILAVSAIGPFFPQLVMLIFGIASVLFAAFAIFTQDDIKRKLAYSSCENIGIVALCLGFGGTVGITAALLQCVFHAITKSLLFCLSGNLTMKYGTRDLKVIKGVLQAMPITAVLLCIGLFTISGFPPFALFTSELSMMMAGLNAGLLWIVIIVGLALTVVVAAFATIAARNVIKKVSKDEMVLKKKDVSILALIPEAVLAICVIWFGVAAPSQLTSSINSAAGIILNEEAADGSGNATGDSATGANAATATDSASAANGSNEAVMGPGDKVYQSLSDATASEGSGQQSATSNTQVTGTEAKSRGDIS
ncbi:MAG: hydrogenase 4 subunit F [Coriobacteriales bacterium]|nr:hydrogenase 4 subunit F [Coriobacteriales bacterium]